MKLYETLIAQLEIENDYVDDNGKVKKWVVADKARNFDPELLALLLQNKDLKKTFFKDIRGTVVFLLEKFLLFIEQKNYLNDSYTAYQNKIGLSIGGKLLNQRDEVELVWPYKDCVLEGGQTKEEQKRSEIFFNQTLAHDEITQLFDPKVLTNHRKYGVFVDNGIFQRDAIYNTKRGLPPNTITDNLIIKGNNLLVLHSLKKEFAGKVKLIYIDPPYYFTKPKSSDTFSYNSNFRLSTWLVFMKNRLSVANELLTNGGVILCHIKEDAVHWLKVLMEEIFKTENFIETFIWKNTDNADSLSKKSRSSVEYILCFEKNKDLSKKYVGKSTENGDAPLLNSGNSIHSLVFPKGTVHFKSNKVPDGIYKSGKPNRVVLRHDVIVENGLNKDSIELEGEFKWSQEYLDAEVKKGTFFIVKSKDFSIRFQRKEGSTMAPEKYIEEQYLSKGIGVGTNEDASTHLKNLDVNFTNSKPESVVAFFLRAMTNENDLVLDFFLGSGTTAAVAHKMKRQYIGVEQMDYLETETIKRMQKVIDGEQGGVSKSVGWNPKNPSMEDISDGRYSRNSFVYFELKKYNEIFIERIDEAETTEDLLQIWEQMKEKSFLAYNVDVKTQDANIEDFKQLDLLQQKQVLCELLDKNQLYMNVSDMDDDRFDITEKERAVTESFYSIR